MNLSSLLLVIGSIALLLTFVIGLIYKSHKSWIMTFLQNFTGVLFIFSGWVKAVDPLGTAFKMEEYFAEFESTFEATWFSFLTPLFPFLSEYAVGFSVFMITFEIVLGVMLLLGVRQKLTSWAFLLLVGFFAFLTGFTFLTGYVPGEVNFFSFGKWGAFDENNMKVTDCGCFGDFIKLKPKISFYKDLVLLAPALFFVFKHKDMHRLFTSGIRTGLSVLTAVGIFLYCLSNYMWDIPHTDFRPFKKGADIRMIRQAEFDAAANVPLSYEITNKETGEKIEISYDQFRKEFQKYPKESFDLVQLRGKPSIPITKISDYDITSVFGDDLTEELLNDPNPSVMIVSYQLKGSGAPALRMVRDSVYTADTLKIEGTDSIFISPQILKIKQHEEEYTEFIWKKSFAKAYTEVIKPFTDAALGENIKVYAVAGGADRDMMEELKNELDLNFEFYTADDILLKTIVRSNPGIVLWKNGRILDKWHYKKLPNFDKIKEKYLKS